MKIRIISVARTREKHLLSLEAEYVKRMRAFAQVELLELGLELSSSISEKEAMKREGEAILAKIKSDEYLIVMDEHGSEIESRKLASFFEGKMRQGHSKYCIVIGGPYGLDPAVKKRAGLLLSLSRLTFPYQVARLIIIEQLYRCYTLIKGIPYHK